MLLAALHPTPGFTGVGFDENLYRTYVNGVIEEGLWNYPEIVDRYIEVQKRLAGSILPPMRFLYIFFAYVWHQVVRHGGSRGPAQRRVVLQHSLPASCHGVCLAFEGTRMRTWLSRRWWPLRRRSSTCRNTHSWTASLLFGRSFTLWMLWEALREPRNWRWLFPYLFGLSLMVITKENAAFVYFAILVLHRGQSLAQVGHRNARAAGLHPHRSAARIRHPRFSRRGPGDIAHYLPALGQQELSAHLRDHDRRRPMAPLSCRSATGQPDRLAARYRSGLSGSIEHKSRNSS